MCCVHQNDEYSGMSIDDTKQANTWMFGIEKQRMNFWFGLDFEVLIL